MLNRIYDICVATATTTAASDPTRTPHTDTSQSPAHELRMTRTANPPNNIPTTQHSLDNPMYDDLPDLIYPSDDEPSPSRTPIPYATLTDDQKNPANCTTDIQNTTGATTPTLYDIRVATHHDESADSASIDSNDDTHVPPGADETDPPDTYYHHSTDDEEPQPHHPNERTQQTIKYSDGSTLLSHVPITATGYPPLLDNATSTHSHQMYIASSQTATTCWTPPTKSTIPSLSKNAYSHTHARASPGQTISPQSHPHNARSTRASHQCTPTTNHTSKATHDPQDPLEQPYPPDHQHPHAHPHKNNQRATSAQEVTLQYTHPPKLPSASAQNHRNYPQPPRRKLHLGEAATPHSKTPQNHPISFNLIQLCTQTYYNHFHTRSPSRRRVPTTKPPRKPCRHIFFNTNPKVDRTSTSLRKTSNQK
jgi:hypothetical protein